MGTLAALIVTCEWFTKILNNLKMTQAAIERPPSPFGSPHDSQHGNVIAALDFGMFRVKIWTWDNIRALAHIFYIRPKGLQPGICNLLYPDCNIYVVTAA